MFTFEDMPFVSYDLCELTMCDAGVPAFEGVVVVFGNQRMSKDDQRSLLPFRAFPGTGSGEMLLQSAMKSDETGAKTEMREMTAARRDRSPTNGSMAMLLQRAPTGDDIHTKTERKKVARFLFVFPSCVFSRDGFLVDATTTTATSRCD